MDYYILCVLGDGCLQRDICNLALTSKQTIHSALKKMEKQGFFGSAFFTALNNGMVSAVISFARTLVFQIVCVLVLPMFLELNGIWISILVAEFLGILVTASLLIANRKKYSYF